MIFTLSDPTELKAAMTSETEINPKHNKSDILTAWGCAQLR